MASARQRLSLLLLGTAASLSLAAEVSLPSGCDLSSTYDADSDTTTWTASSSLTCGSGEAVDVTDEGQSLIIDVGTYDVVFDGVTFSVGSFATSSCSGGASLDINGDAAEGSVTFNGSGSGTALSLSGNGADVDINVPAFFNDWENGADASAQSSCSTKLTFGSDAIFTGITGTGLSAFETTWEVQGRAAFHDVATPADQRGTGQQSQFGTCVELGPGVPTPSSSANYPNPILPFELCTDAIYGDSLRYNGVELPSACEGMRKEFDFDTLTTIWTAAPDLVCGDGTSQLVTVAEEGETLIISLVDFSGERSGLFDVVFDGVSFAIGSGIGCNGGSGGASLQARGDFFSTTITFQGDGTGTALSLNGNGAAATFQVPVFFLDWENGARVSAVTGCSTLSLFSDAVFIGISDTALWAFEGTWNVGGRAAFYDIGISSGNQLGTGQQSSFGSCVELGPNSPLPASTENYPNPILPFELCTDAIYAPETAPPTPTPTSPPVAPPTSPPVAPPTGVNCASLGWVGSCGAFTDADSCNCWAGSAFACSWSGTSCGTGGGGGGPAPTPPPVTAPTPPPVAPPTGVNCASLGWAGSCGAFTDAGSCNCWAGSAFACSWSGNSCGTGGGGGGPTPTPPPVTTPTPPPVAPPTGVNCASLGWAGSCGAFTDAGSCNCWAGSAFACSWSGSSCGTGGGGGGPAPTPPPVTAPTPPPVAPPTGVNCASLGWAGSCGAFTDADSCNCWAGSAFACSWSGSSCI